jgi:hypothetical protein
MANNSRTWGKKQDIPGDSEIGLKGDKATEAFKIDFLFTKSELKSLSLQCFSRFHSFSLFFWGRMQRRIKRMMRVRRKSAISSLIFLG